MIFFAVPLVLSVERGNFWWLLIAILYLAIREYFQFHQFFLQEQKRSFCALFGEAFKSHFKFTSNIYEAFLVLSILILGIGCELCPSEDIKKILMVLIITIALPELGILIAETFPSCSIFMIMIRKVAVTFLKVFFIILMYLMAFGFCFHLILKPDKSDFNSFDTIPTSVVKIVTMFSGEFEAKELKMKSDFSYFLFFAFILSIIVLFNFVNALAISDVQLCAAKADAEILDLKIRVLRLRKHEKFLKTESWISNNSCTSWLVGTCRNMTRLKVKSNGQTTFYKNDMEAAGIELDNDICDKLKMIVRENEKKRNEESENVKIMKTICKLTKLSLKK
jgi:hypothetical protein